MLMILPLTFKRMGACVYNLNQNKVFMHIEINPPKKKSNYFEIIDQGFKSLCAFLRVIFFPPPKIMKIEKTN